MSAELSGSRSIVVAITGASGAIYADADDGGAPRAADATSSW